MIQKVRAPLISILMYVGNAEWCVEQAVNSLLSQTYNNIEVIAVDDFSKDKSYSILTEIKLRDRRLRVFRNVKRYGHTVSLNRAIKKARGEFIAFMSPFDLCYPNKLESQADYLINEEKTVAVGTQCLFFTSDNLKGGQSDFPIDSLSIYKTPLQGISLQFETIMINRSIIPKDLLYFHSNNNLYLYSDVIVKLLAYGKIVNLPDVYYIHRRLNLVDLPNIRRNLASLVKLWMRAEAFSGQRPSWKLLFFENFFRPRTNI